MKIYGFVHYVIDNSTRSCGNIETLRCGYMGQSSGEIWVLRKIGELAERCGVSPVAADINLTFDSERGYQLAACCNGQPSEGDKVGKVWHLLGLNDEGYRNFGVLREVDEAVDQALDRAPRSRFR